MTASRLKLRLLKDRLTTIGMGIGGISVIIAIVLIFFYLIYIVYPLFIPADVNKVAGYATPDTAAGNTVMLAIEEQNEVGTRFTDQAKAVFFNTRTGDDIKTVTLSRPRNTSVTSFSSDQLINSIVAWGLNNGQAIVTKHVYKVSYGEKDRTITPVLEYPLGQTPLLLNKKRTALKKIAVATNEEETSIVTLTAENKLLLSHFQPEEGLFDEDTTVPLTHTTIELPDVANVEQILINSEQRILYLLQAGNEITLIDISDKSAPEFMGRVRIAPENAKLASVHFLTGGISLLIGTDAGQISQWFPVKHEEGTILQKVRSFDPLDGPVTDIMTEQRRKGFITATKNGVIGIHHSTAQRTLINKKIADSAIHHISISPRADSIIAEDKNGQFQFWHVTNEHPEISWDVLWGKVWYESYPEPSYTWQSSSASNDFEPKYSLMPLAFGTLKAAFYAMLFAMPLAIMGAIYTAYFMAPKMRTYVKPTIEIMEALPTVILGFLAGLWLAPIIESHLPGVFQYAYFSARWCFTLCLEHGNSFRKNIGMQFPMAGKQHY